MDYLAVNEEIKNALIEIYEQAEVTADDREILRELSLSAVNGYWGSVLDEMGVDCERESLDIATSLTPRMSSFQKLQSSFDRQAATSKELVAELGSNVISAIDTKKALDVILRHAEGAPQCSCPAHSPRIRTLLEKWHSFLSKESEETA